MRNIEIQHSRAVDRLRKGKSGGRGSTPPPPSSLLTALQRTLDTHKYNVPNFYVFQKCNSNYKDLLPT